MLWCERGLAGDPVGDLFKVEDTVNQHGYHSIPVSCIIIIILVQDQHLCCWDVNALEYGGKRKTKSICLYETVLCKKLVSVSSVVFINLYILAS